MKKVYKVKTRFVFEGVFKINASNKEEARRLVQDNCGMVMGERIQSTLDDDEVDWEFCCHPDKKIVSITK